MSANEATKLFTIRRNVRASLTPKNYVSRGMTTTVKVQAPFGKIFLHAHHLCGVVYEVTFSKQGVADPDLDAILEPLFEGITEALQSIRGDWDR